MILGHHRIAAAASPRPPQVPCIADYVGTIPYAYGFTPGTFSLFWTENIEEFLFDPLHGNSTEFDCPDKLPAPISIELAYVALLLRLPVFVYHDDPDDLDDRRHDDDTTTTTTTTKQHLGFTATKAHDDHENDHDDHDDETRSRDRSHRSLPPWLTKTEGLKPATSAACRWKSSRSRSLQAGVPA